jgi:hypothetical protein
VSRFLFSICWDLPVQLLGDRTQHGLGTATFTAAQVCPLVSDACEERFIFVGLLLHASSSSFRASVCGE